ncbi:MAG: DUF2461 domain-containing protein [Ilumatobacter sp.]|nr:DUF2461 domain-containing protein [Ilumatobacter sp.]
MAFSGFPAAGIEFYEQLSADNSRAFWQDNKHRYVEHVKAPMLELAEVLADYGPFHLFRPHNDLRFSKNKPPYKTAQGAYGESEGGAGFYVHFSAEGLMAGGGYYAMASDQLQRFRAAVDAEATGEEIAGIVAAMQRRTYSIGAIDELKTAPRGYPKDHPRIELLRRKGLTASKTFGAPKWIHTAAAATRIRQTWEGMSEMCAWLDTHVGPSTEPPGDRPF